MILVGGVLLLTPGFLTDLLGFTLLIPLTRELYTNIAINFFKRKFQTSQNRHSSFSEFNSSNNSDEVIIDHPKIEE
jgi:UPF0716 protein FxsA